MNEGDALGQAFVVLDQGRLRDSVGSILQGGLDEDRIGQALRAPDAPSVREDGKGGHPDSVVGEKLLGKRLVSRNHHSLRIAAGVRNVHKLQEGDHVLVVQGYARVFFEEVESDVRFPSLDLLPQGSEITVDCEHPHLVTEFLQGHDHVVLGLPRSLDDLFVAQTLHRFRRLQPLGDQNEDAKLSHSSTHLGFR